MPGINEAADNVRRATDLALGGNLGGAFKMLREGNQTTSVGDDPATSIGDDYGYPGYPSTSDGDSYWPYEPPIASPTDYPPPPLPVVNIAPGWYPDPFDGQGYRWWNGQGWTTTTSG